MGRGEAERWGGGHEATQFKRYKGKAIGEMNERNEK